MPRVLPSRPGVGPGVGGIGGSSSPSRPGIAVWLPVSSSSARTTRCPRRNSQPSSSAISEGDPASTRGGSSPEGPASPLGSPLGWAGGASTAATAALRSSEWSCSAPSAPEARRERSERRVRRQKQPRPCQDQHSLRGSVRTCSPVFAEESPWLATLPHLRLRLRLLHRAGTRTQGAAQEVAAGWAAAADAHLLLPRGSRSLAANEALLEVVRVAPGLGTKPATMLCTTKAQRAARAGRVRPSRVTAASS